MVYMRTPYYYRRRHRLSDTQLVKVADALGDVAQIMFATFFIPFFIGESPFIRAFIGGGIAVMLWFWSISIVR